MADSNFTCMPFLLISDKPCCRLISSDTEKPVSEELFPPSLVNLFHESLYFLLQFIIVFFIFTILITFCIKNITIFIIFDISTRNFLLVVNSFLYIIIAIKQYYSSDHLPHRDHCQCYHKPQLLVLFRPFRTLKEEG
ncbi:hypothetical protein OIU84_015968 [Salix udensis]|uniref:Uncharacterized protein n=1 Tax=Salix udensis TaxID=889485 RepID=A0AAD6J979_9ROSI|nr:hypothetical protein OIU84_015968 [Salix udensis]